MINNKFGHAVIGYGGMGHFHGERHENIKDIEFLSNVC